VENRIQTLLQLGVGDGVISATQDIVASANPGCMFPMEASEVASASDAEGTSTSSAS